MDMSIFRQKELLPSLIFSKLCSIPIDYKEKYRQFESTMNTAAPHRVAGVVLLLNYKQLSTGGSEYVFQLIKRSDLVSQAGDISCPGGMLHPSIDKIISLFLTTGLFPSLHKGLSKLACCEDKESIDLVRLFLSNALREAWEEIGLNPLAVSFLGALPTYSLILMTRTIFPLVCLTTKPYEFRLSPEVDKVLEIPLSTFFDGSRYAQLEIETSFHHHMSRNQFPCIVLNDDQEEQDILWGATFYIIMNFLRIISDDSLPVPSSTDKIKRVLSDTYISGNNRQKDKA
ncbi:MAG: CoA pyrophosphatase [Smithellaceae bacterium]